MIRSTIAALITIGLVGCATTETVWNKSNSSEQEFNMESGQCRASAFGVSNPSMMQIAIVYNSCMQGKGWQLEERTIRK